MSLPHSLVILFSATAALALFAGACGGDDDNSGSNGGDGKATATTAGKGSGDDDDSNDAGYKPCDLLTKEEVEAALGEPIDAPETSITGNPLGQTLCMYGAAAETSFGYVQVSVIREKDIMESLRKTGQTAKKLYTEGKALFGAGTVQDVSGVGDAAYREGSSLTVLSGGVLLTVGANIKGTKPADISTDVLKSLAQKALPRVPK